MSSTHEITKLARNKPQWVVNHFSPDLFIIVLDQIPFRKERRE